MARLERCGGEGLSLLPVQDDEKGPRGHAIIVGDGRVGSIIGKSLKDQGLPITVVDLDRRGVKELRERGVAGLPHPENSERIFIAGSCADEQGTSR
jgi:CPA2 family monovalent cation:H+ antiporter-2